MQNSNFKYWVKIPALLILTIFFFGLLTSCSFQSGNNTLNSNANLSNTNTSNGQSNQNNPIKYDNIKTILEDRINKSCGAKQPKYCNVLINIKLISELDQNVNPLFSESENEQNTFNEFKETCLQKVFNELQTSPSLKPSSDTGNPTDDKSQLAKDLDEGCSKNKEVLQTIFSKLKNPNNKLKEQNDKLIAENKGLKESGIGEILIQLLFLLLVLSIIGLIVYQIWNQAKFSNLPDSLNEVKSIIGTPVTGKDIVKIVSDEGQNIQNQIKELSEIIRSSNLNVEKQIDELNRQSLEEARRKEAEQNRDNKPTTSIEGSFTQSNEQQSSNNESEFEYLKGLVSDIHKNFNSVKTDLTKHFYKEVLKPISSGAETATYYGIPINKNGVIKNYAIPVADRINSSAQATHLYDFYTIYESTTSALNGKLKIEEPTEIKWDQKINGWELVKKGKIKIVS